MQRDTQYVSSFPFNCLLYFITRFFLGFCFQWPPDLEISIYLSGVMVRHMLVLVPAACVLSAIAASGLLRGYMRNLDALRVALVRRKVDRPHAYRNEV